LAYGLQLVTDCQLVTDVRARKLRSADIERSLATGPAAVSASGRSLLLLRLEYGTVCRLT